MARAGYVPARGDFVRLVLDPRVGREQSGERLALVLSDQARSIDCVARHVRYLTDAPADLVEAVLARVAAILSL